MIAFNADKNGANLLKNDYHKQKLNSTPQPNAEQHAINSADSLFRAIDRIKLQCDQSSTENELDQSDLNSRSKTFAYLAKGPLHSVSSCPSVDKRVTLDSLITGALESAFWEMDFLIASDKTQYRMYGGCTAIASLFILGKLYVANAGDSR